MNDRDTIPAADPDDGHPDDAPANPDGLDDYVDPRHRSRTRAGIAIIVLAVVAVMVGGVALIVTSVNSEPLKWQGAEESSDAILPPKAPSAQTTSPATTVSPSQSLAPSLNDYREPVRGRGAAPNNSWLSAPRATPGMTIAQPDGDTLDTCTLALFGSLSGETVGLTAAYCRRAGDDVYYKTSSQPQTFDIASTLPFGTFEHVDQGALDGVGIIAVRTGLATNPLVGNRVRILGVLDPNQLRAGMQVCKYGYRTQETCGDITTVTDTSILADLYTRRGDAGALAYVKVSPTAAYAVGVQSGRLNEPAETQTAVRFAYLKPAFDEYGITLS